MYICFVFPLRGGSSSENLNAGAEVTGLIDLKNKIKLNIADVKKKEIWCFKVFLKCFRAVFFFFFAVNTWLHSVGLLEIL